MSVNWVNKFSQHNEEKTLYRLFELLQLEKKTTTKNKLIAVDIGAGDGTYLSNTKFLTEPPYPHYEQWTRIMIDADSRGHSPPVFEIKLDRDNIIPALKECKVPKDIDLVSLDIDGNDYWLWKTILESKEFNPPTVIITELNSIFHPHESYTIQYNPHHSWQNDDYYGASYLAFDKLFKGYNYQFYKSTPCPETPVNGIWVQKDSTPLLFSQECDSVLPQRFIGHKHRGDAYWVPI